VSEPAGGQGTVEREPPLLHKRVPRWFERWLETTMVLRVLAAAPFALGFAYLVWYYESPLPELVPRPPFPTALHSVPPAAWQRPAPTEPDPFGYPANDVDRTALLAMLAAERYAELEGVLEGLWQAQRADPRHEIRLEEAYAAFALDTPAVRRGIEAWIAARPASLAADLAAAMYYARSAGTARGEAWASDTSPDRFAAMEAELERGWRYWRRAQHAAPDHPVVFVAGFSLLQYRGWSDATQRLLAAGERVLPASAVLRQRALDLAAPRWGGSLQLMERIARRAQRNAALNPRLVPLLGEADRERARIALEAGDLPAARAAIERALRHGPENRLLRQRARVWLAAGDAGRAALDAHAALAQRPQGPDGLEIYGQSLYWLALMAPVGARAARLDAATAALDAALAQAPSDPQARWWRERIDGFRGCRLYLMRCADCQFQLRDSPMCQELDRVHYAEP
jgi:hypothetical protein